MKAATFLLGVGTLLATRCVLSLIVDGVSPKARRRAEDQILDGVRI